MEKQNYDRLTLKYVKISSYMKLCAAAGFAFGLLKAVFQFGVAILNLTATASIGSIVLKGVPAALMILVFTPLHSSFYAVVFSLISYFPLMFILQKGKGITLEGVFDRDAEEGEGAGQKI